MFFTLSKLFWMALQPVNVVGVLMLVAMVAALLSWRRLATAASTLAFLLFATFAWTSAGAFMLRPLESRFPAPTTAPQRVDGIIVLGGAFQNAINDARGGVELTDAGDRMVEGAMLALRYPDARLVISGGNGSLNEGLPGDAATAPPFFAALGVPPERLLIEAESRNTDENARFTKRLVTPRPGEVWLLVTSAFHMPRSVGLFRKAGFDVVPWPVDYRTTGKEPVGQCRTGPIGCLYQVNASVREWIGLVVYRLTGKTDELFPAP